MNIVNRPNNVFALKALFIFISVCSLSCSSNARKYQSASIAAIEAEYYAHGNFGKTYQIASAAAYSYHQKNAIKQEAEALIWMAEMKFVQGDYSLCSGYLNRVQPIIGKLRDDSLAVGSYLLRGELFTARILPDSAKWCFLEAEKQIQTKNYQTGLLKIKLVLKWIVLYQQLHQTKKVDSLILQILNNPDAKSFHHGYYYDLALASKIQSINENGSPDSALRLSEKLAGLVNHKFSQNSYLHTVLYQALSRSGLNNMDYDASLKYARKELVSAHASKNATALFYAYYDVQQAYSNNQDFKNVIAFTDSMDQTRANTFPEKSLEANAVNISYGRTFTNTHDYSRAKFYLQKSITLNGNIFGQNSEELAKAYSLMGNLYSYQGQFDSVLYYNQKVLDIRKKIFPEDHLQIAFCLDDIARTYNNMDNPKLALPYQQKVEKIYKKNYGPTHSYIAWAYDAEADSYGQLHEFDKAVLYSDKALELFIPGMSKDTDAINHTSEIPFDIYLPDYLTSRIQIFCNRGLNATGKDKKIKYLQEAYRLSNATNNYIKNYTEHFDSPESVAIVYQRMYEYYKLCAEVSYHLYELTGEEKYRSSILNYAENKRGAFLRSSILNSKSIKFSGVPASVIKEETHIRNTVTAAADKAVSVHKKDSINKVYEQFLNNLSTHYANYYRLKYLPYELNEGAVKRWLPNDSTVFVEYMVSKEHVFILVISKKACSLVSLEKKDSILNQIASLSKSLRQSDSKTYYTKAYAVYQYLVQPMEQYIKQGSKVIISADGALSNLNFEALVTKPQAINNGFNANDFLLNKYNISYAVSAFSLLNPFNKEDSIKEKDRAYFSAPGFDDHLKDDYKRFAASHQLPLDNEYMSYLYQPFMMQLGDALSSTWKVTKEEGSDATESDFKKKASGNNIIQIGSHALLNDIDPMRSCLVFAKELSTSNTNDGYLYSSEIYNQRINADLVILTACETGGGQYKEGEGMMSLSYSFEYAGCKSAIMSLWPVDEKTSSTITESFYQHLAGGESTSVSLYHAKKDFLQTADAGLINPFYWSGLVLLGQDEKIELKKNNNTGQYGWLFGTLGIATIGIVGFRKWKNKKS